jgi:glycosyltransferase involved in cell wall biosynthesis
MRIAIELLEMFPGNTGGMETYARCLIDTLAARAPEHDYLLVLNTDAEREFDCASKNRTLLVPDSSAPAFIRRSSHLRFLWQWVHLRKPLREWRHDVYHSTMNFARPMFGIRNLVLTVHDIMFVTHPQFGSQLSAMVGRLVCAASVRNARTVITDSEYVRGTLIDCYRLKEDKVAVVHPGVDHNLFRPQEGHTQIAFSSTTQLPDNFLFFPAATAPNKNHLTLLRALRILREQFHLCPPLVLTGFPRQSHEELLTAAAALGEHQVTWLGFVDKQTLAKCYQRASALVFPSLHEGFGLPVLEAMAAGCPVACSNTTATKEVAGDAALTFTPTDPEGMAATIHKLLTDSSIRAELRARGLTRASGYSWDRTAQEIVRLYQRASGVGDDSR